MKGDGGRKISRYAGVQHKDALLGHCGDGNMECQGKCDYEE